MFSEFVSLFKFSILLSLISAISLVLVAVFFRALFLFSLLIMAKLWCEPQRKNFWLHWSSCILTFFCYLLFYTSLSLFCESFSNFVKVEHFFVLISDFCSEIMVWVRPVLSSLCFVCAWKEYNCWMEDFIYDHLLIVSFCQLHLK